jgi:GTPase SAR1 family protein
MDKVYHIAVLGAKGVGKSTFINNFSKYNNTLYTNKGVFKVQLYRQPDDLFMIHSFFKKLHIFSDGNIILSTNGEKMFNSEVPYLMNMSNKYCHNRKTIICDNLNINKPYTYELESKIAIEKIINHLVNDSIIIE